MRGIFSALLLVLDVLPVILLFERGYAASLPDTLVQCSKRLGLTSVIASLPMEGTTLPPAMTASGRDARDVLTELSRKLPGCYWIADGCLLWYSLPPQSMDTVTAHPEKVRLLRRALSLLSPEIREAVLAGAGIWLDRVTPECRDLLLRLCLMDYPDTQKETKSDLQKAKRVVFFIVILPRAIVRPSVGYLNLTPLANPPFSCTFLEQGASSPVAQVIKPPLLERPLASGGNQQHTVAAVQLPDPLPPSWLNQTGGETTEERMSILDGRNMRAITGRVMTLDEAVKEARTLTRIEIRVDQRHATRRVFLLHPALPLRVWLKGLCLATGLSARRVGDIVMLAPDPTKLMELPWYGDAQAEAQMLDELQTALLRTESQHWPASVAPVMKALTPLLLQRAVKHRFDALPEGWRDYLQWAVDVQMRRRRGKHDERREQQDAPSSALPADATVQFLPMTVAYLWPVVPADDQGQGSRRWIRDKTLRGAGTVF